MPIKAKLIKRFKEAPELKVGKIFRIKYYDFWGFCIYKFDTKKYMYRITQEEFKEHFKRM